MLEMLINSAIALVIITAAVITYAATRPSEFEVTRSTVIAAPADAVFPLINHLRWFNRWNPFLLKDQATQLTYQSTQEGPGAAYGWAGNREVGKGSLEIVQSVPHKSIELALHIQQPIAAHNRIVFTLEPADAATDAATKVTWTMTGTQPLMGKLVGLFINIDAMVGADFEIGLQRLKALAENTGARV